MEAGSGLPPACSADSLGSQCCQDLQNLVAICAPDWSVDLHYDEQGQAAIVISPGDLDDAADPSFIVYADKATFHVDEWRGDAYRRLGEHRNWADCLRSIQIILLWEQPCVATCH